MRKSFLAKPVRRKRKHVVFETDTEPENYEVQPSEEETSEMETSAVELSKPDVKPKDVPVLKQNNQEAVKMSANTYWLTRIIFIRSIAFVYCKCS